MTEVVGVLLLAYGTPASPADIAPYYTHIRRGRPPTPELLEELTGRYQAIGGSSPLLQIAKDQAGGVQQRLRERLPETDPRVILGMKHAHPFIEEAVAELAALNADRALGLVLAPHYSEMSVAEYHRRVRAAADEHGLSYDFAFINEWHLEPGYIDLLAGRVDAALVELKAEGATNPRILFTAHSLPTRILESGDPYPTQLAETATAVAQRAGINEYGVAWQSAGRTGEPWIGPDVCEVVRELGAGGEYDGVLVCAAGFVSDHLEILYDLDIQAYKVARDAGLHFARTASPNADPEFLDVLAQVAGDRLSAAAA